MRPTPAKAVVPGTFQREGSKKRRQQMTNRVDCVPSTAQAKRFSGLTPEHEIPLLAIGPQSDGPLKKMTDAILGTLLQIDKTLPFIEGRLDGLKASHRARLDTSAQGAMRRLLHRVNLQNRRRPPEGRDSGEAQSRRDNRYRQHLASGRTADSWNGPRASNESRFGRRCDARLQANGDAGILSSEQPGAGAREASGDFRHGPHTVRQSGQCLLGLTNSFFTISEDRQ